jgi:hypothetical protein
MTPVDAGHLPCFVRYGVEYKEGEDSIVPEWDHIEPGAGQFGGESLTQRRGGAETRRRTMAMVNLWIMAVGGYISIWSWRSRFNAVVSPMLMGGLWLIS